VELVSNVDSDVTSVLDVLDDDRSLPLVDPAAASSSALATR
jgi:hypothetical protein